MDEKVRLTVSANSSQRASAGLRWDSEFGVEEPDRPAHWSLWTGAQSRWNRKGPSPNCSHKVESMKMSAELEAAGKL